MPRKVSPSARWSLFCSLRYVVVSCGTLPERLPQGLLELGRNIDFVYHTPMATYRECPRSLMRRSRLGARQIDQSAVPCFDETAEYLPVATFVWVVLLRLLAEGSHNVLAREFGAKAE